MGKRKRSSQRRTPDGRIKQKWIEEPFVIHRRSMVISPAWEALPDNARRVLDRLEREHMDQGGSENGKLICTYSDFEKAGLRRKSIALAIRQCEALGFVSITSLGGRSLATQRLPSLYRLTYVSGKGDSTDVTDEWKTVGSQDDAQARLANLVEVRNYRGQPRSRRKSPEAKTPPGRPKAGGENATPLYILPGRACSVTETGSARQRVPAVFALIPLALIEDACRLGWNPTPALHGTPHGEYSALCEFVCCCGRTPVLPGRGDLARAFVDRVYRKSGGPTELARKIYAEHLEAKRHFRERR